MGKLIPRGTYGVLLTPFDAKGRLDEGALRNEIDYCICAKLQGLLVCGSTGEFVYMSPEQNKRVLTVAAEMAGNKKVLIGGASATTEERVLDYLCELAALGYPYAIICPPYYYPQKDDDILSFYQTVSRRAPQGLKLILYNIPFCAPGIPLSILPKLLECENIVGMKDSSGDLLYLSRTISRANALRPDFSVLCGQDCALLSGLTLGTQGLMSSMAWILHETVSQIVGCYDGGDLKRAERLQTAIVALVDHLDAIPFPENYRALADLAGVPCGVPQRPFASLDSPAVGHWKGGAEKLLSDLGRL